MTVRLHEIELGTADVPGVSQLFQTLLGLGAQVKQPELTVLDSGVPGVDFNLSTHHLPGQVCISFLTDDLAGVEKRLVESSVLYEGPADTHLGMRCLRFWTADGYTIVVNTPGPASPAWLRV